tara:strand:+ start:288 stop:581 length:294 start_codon:yes stop_codon:yes gene_type:complete
MSPAVTSRIAYKEIKQDGTSSTQKQGILEAVKGSENGLSLREICKLTGFDINAVSGRVNDLKKEGMLETTSKRKCTITSRLISPVALKSQVDIPFSI